jgi:cytosine/adenosine deaminase-related metal-dependent hydrolase
VAHELQRKIIGAEVVYNGLGTPRSNGAVVLETRNSHTRVISFEAYQSARKAFPDAMESGKDFAVSPPPVNSHTHLDLSNMSYSPGSYPNFIEQVVRHRRGDGRPLDAAKSGAELLIEAGTRVIGDIVASHEVMRFLLKHPKLRGVAYWEVFEPDPAAANHVLAETEEIIRTYRALEKPDGMRVGLSLHTPHTVSDRLLRGMTALAIKQSLPLQIHVAETTAELAFHRNGTGPFRELYGDLLNAWEPSGLTPIGYLASLGVLEAQPTLVHMVHVTEADVREVQKAGCSIVHCPRSNETLNCGRFPWAMYARHGVTVGIGTDSLGSAPNLSIYEEVFAAQAIHGPEASPLALVRSVVKGGHRALGLQPPRVLRGDTAEHLQVWGRNGPRRDLIF